jgi:hypothetical protein
LLNCPTRPAPAMKLRANSRPACNRKRRPWPETAAAGCGKVAPVLGGLLANLSSGADAGRGPPCEAFPPRSTAGMGDARDSPMMDSCAAPLRCWSWLSISGWSPPGRWVWRAAFVALAVVGGDGVVSHCWWLFEGMFRRRRGPLVWAFSGGSLGVWARARAPGLDLWCQLVPG